jgi:hypothetical protein
MRCFVVAVTAAAVLALAPGADARDAIANAPHLRAATDASAGLVTMAQAKSQTVRDLLAKLEQTDVVAYVHVATVPSGTPESSLRFGARSSRQRFVVVQVSNTAEALDQIALLGHELQHAVEMASARWVVDQGGMRSFFRAMGWRAKGSSFGVETSAALGAERRIHLELAQAGRPRP